MERLYVNTCGESRQDPRHEYAWKSWNNEHSDEEVNKLLSAPRFGGASLADLVAIESRDPSIVFARHGDDLWLLVTKIPSRRRRSSQGDVVFMSLLWQMEASSEPLARALLVNLLRFYPSRREDFSAEEMEAGKKQRFPVVMEVVDVAVKFHEEDGFRVEDGEEFFRMCRDCMDWDGADFLAKPGLESWDGRIAHNCAKLRRELAFELLHFRMPAGDGPLLVVTGALPEQALAANRVWRGLTTMLESLNWMPYRNDATWYRGNASPTNWKFWKLWMTGKWLQSESGGVYEQ